MAASETILRNAFSRIRSPDCFLKSSMHPSATIRPWWTMAISSQSRSTSLIMCVEKITVSPSLRHCSMKAMIVCEVMTSSPLVGSSNIITGGLWTMERAMETRCFCPVDSLSQRPFAKSPISNCSMSSSIRAFRADSSIPLSLPKYSIISRAVSLP